MGEKLIALFLKGKNKTSRLFHNLDQQFSNLRIKKRTINIYDEKELTNEKIAILNKFIFMIGNFQNLIDEIEKNNFLTKNLEISEGVSLIFLYKKVKVLNQMWFNNIWIPKMETYIYELKRTKTELKVLQHRFIGTNITLPFVYDEVNEFIESEIDKIEEHFLFYKSNLESLLATEFSINNIIDHIPLLKEIGNFLIGILKGSTKYEIEGNTFELVHNLKTITAKMKAILHEKRIRFNHLILEKKWYCESEIARKQQIKFQKWKNNIFPTVLQSVKINLEPNFNILKHKFNEFEQRIKTLIAKHIITNEDSDFPDKLNYEIDKMIAETRKTLNSCIDFSGNWRFNLKIDDCTKNQLKIIKKTTTEIQTIYNKFISWLNLLIDCLELSKVPQNWIISEASLSYGISETTNKNLQDSWFFQNFFEKTTNEIKTATQNFVNISLLLSPEKPKLMTKDQLYQIERYYPLQLTGQYEICDIESRIANYNESTPNWLNLLFEHLNTQFLIENQAINQNFVSEINQFASKIITIWNAKVKDADFHIVTNLIKTEINHMLEIADISVNHLLNQSRQFEEKVLIEEDCPKTEQSEVCILNFQKSICNNMLLQIVELYKIRNKIAYMADNWMRNDENVRFNYQFGDNLERATAIGSNTEWFFKSLWKENNFLKPANTEIIDEPWIESIDNWIQNESVLPICNLSQQVGEGEQILKNERIFLNHENTKKLNFWKEYSFQRSLTPLSNSYSLYINQLKTEINQTKAEINDNLKKLKSNHAEFNINHILTKINDSRNTISNLINQAEAEFKIWSDNLDDKYCNIPQIKYIIEQISEIYCYLKEYHQTLQLNQIKLFEISKNLTLFETRVVLSHEIEGKTFLQDIFEQLTDIYLQIDWIKTDFFENKYSLINESTYQETLLINDTCKLVDNQKFQPLLVETKAKNQIVDTKFENNTPEHAPDTINISALETANWTKNELANNTNTHTSLNWIIFLLTGGFIFLLIFLINYNCSKCSNKIKKSQKTSLTNQFEIDEAKTMIPLDDFHQVARDQCQFTDNYQSAKLNLLNQAELNHYDYTATLNL